MIFSFLNVLFIYLNMTTYLLIRNNKKSGPFLLDQLKEMGFKPYDLIWVEGKSAAWRYPGEVDELKEYIPIVEEQPFDRFYKRPEEKKEKHFHEIIEEAEKMKSAKLQAFSEKQLVTVNETTHPKIFVSMPEPSTPSIDTVKIKEITHKKIDEQTGNLRQVENHDLVSEKNESSIDELKSFYANTYRTRTQKNIRNKNSKKIIEYSVAAFFLLTFGTLIFLNFIPGETKSIVSSAPVKNNFTEKRPILLSPEKNMETISKPDESIESATDMPNEIKVLVPVEKKNRSNDLKASVKNKESGADDIKTVSSQTVSDGQRQKSVRDNDAPIFEKRADISSQVSVIANEYKRRSFGGIENLQLTVVNFSNFILDKVIVELQYLKPSELPLKTEKIEFSAIAPNGSMTLKIPDSPRGIKVLYKITHVASDQFHRKTAGM